MEYIYIHVERCFGYHAHFMSPHCNHTCVASLELYDEAYVGHVWIDGVCVYSVYLNHHNIPYSANGLIQMIEHVMGHNVVEVV